MAGSHFRTIRMEFAQSWKSTMAPETMSSAARLHWLFGPRIIVSLAATKQKGQKFGKGDSWDDTMCRWLSSTRSQMERLQQCNPSKGPAVRVPLVYLNKAMNGTREASKCWSQEIIGTLKPVGFRTIEAVHGMYPEWDVTMSCHGDDFQAEGPAEGLDRLDEVMREGFEVKVLPRIGDPFQASIYTV